MALAAAPFGFKPMRGPDQKMRKVYLNSTHTVIGIGDTIINAASGAVRNAGATFSVAATLLGVAAEPRDANTGGALNVWDPWGQFEIQCDGVSSGLTSFLTNALVCSQGADFTAATTRDTTTLQSKGALLTAGFGTAASLIVLRYADIPGNDLNSATSYPIFVVKFVPSIIAIGI